jgi:hypothetical protein
MNPADTPTVETSRQPIPSPVRHKMIPGVPLRLQFKPQSNLSPAITINADHQGSARQPVETVGSVPATSDAVSQASGSMPTSVTPARRQKTPKLAHVGSNRMTEAQNLRCAFCLLWFSSKRLKKHISECRATARDRSLTCPVCQEVHIAKGLHTHLSRKHLHQAKSIFETMAINKKGVNNFIEVRKKAVLAAAVAAAAAAVQRKTRTVVAPKPTAPTNPEGKPFAHVLSTDEMTLMVRKNGPGHQCSNCLYWFKQPYMRTHVQYCREEPEAKRKKCLICGVVYLVVAFSAHMKQKHPESLQVASKPTTEREQHVANPRNKVKEKETAQPEEPQPKIERTPCRFCQLPIPMGEMDGHLARNHSQTEEWVPHGTVRKFSFILLPPSKEGLREVIERYRKLTRSHPHSLMGVDFEWERLDQIEHLNPNARYVGTKSWKGYAVFEFQHSDRVILECPKSGNATYIIEGNWREMIAASKRDLRSEYRYHCTRIIHCSDWINRVKNAVFSLKHGQPRVVVAPVILRDQVTDRRNLATSRHIVTFPDPTPGEPERAQRHGNGRLVVPL